MSDFRQITPFFWASPQISPSDIAEAAALGFALVVNNRPEGEVEDQTPGPAIAEAVRAAGMDYRAIPVTPGGFSEGQVREMAEALAESQGPVLAYCRSGTRSTLLWSLAQALGGRDPDAIAADAARGGYDLGPIKPLLEEAVAFATTGPDGLGVSTTCHFDPEVASVLVDRIQIQQVMVNLVRNALQAMTESPRRELKVMTRACLDDLLEISVTDSGSGIEGEFRGKLFEPFQSTKPGGMGLGLSICQTIVETHGGRIKFEPAFGGGSTFSFTIPVAMEAVS